MPDPATVTHPVAPTRQGDRGFGPVRGWTVLFVWQLRQGPPVRPFVRSSQPGIPGRDFNQSLAIVAAALVLIGGLVAVFKQ